VTPTAALWLPILLSAVAVFILSALINMLTPWHAADYRQLPNEAAVADALRPHAIPPGDYMLPRPSGMADMSSPEFIERMNRGPRMTLSVLPNGPSNLGRSLVLWFIFVLVVTLIGAHLAGGILPASAVRAHVFHVVGLFAFAAYALALWPVSIWYGRGWGITLRATVDGLIYAIATGLIFMWLWPR
jgi:hypothetical protein